MNRLSSCFLAAAAVAAVLLVPALHADPVPSAPAIQLRLHETPRLHRRRENTSAQADRRLAHIGMEQGRAALDAFQKLESEQLRQKLLSPLPSP